MTVLNKQCALTIIGMVHVLPLPGSAGFRGNLETVVEAALIVTGAATGVPPVPQDVADVRTTARGPVLVGSGVTESNVHEFAAFCDAIIVGSSLKVDGRWHNRVDADRVTRFVNAARSVSAKST